MAYSKRDMHKDRTMQAGLDLAETCGKVQSKTPKGQWFDSISDQSMLVGEALLDGLVAGA